MSIPTVTADPITADAAPTLARARSTSTRRSPSHPRRHGVRLEPSDRRALERAGWRTTLDYREDHIRGRDGRLVEVVPSWIAEAERYTGEIRFAAATAGTIDEVWALLRARVEEDRTDASSRVRLLRR